MAHTQQLHHHWIRRLALPALGVVFGDIGTSPLYTFRECLRVAGGDPSDFNVFGILSLVIWAITFVVTFKYVTFIMRADNDREGGIMALLALVLEGHHKGRYSRRLVILAGLIGAALFYGDGVITPAISVLSAIEGLSLITPAFEPFVVVIALSVMVGLFGIQKHGTAGVGKWFGPIMLIWFCVLGLVGIDRIIEVPRVLVSFNPWYAIHFVLEHPGATLMVFGAVVLAVTGGEALYADMGHFGIKPIRASWFALVYPSLVLNYLGQGAHVLAYPEDRHNPFFLMFPDWALVPMVGLATVGTVIASQAVISGAFSLTQQAFLMGYLPRLKIEHTSETERGQIYLPGINRWLMVGVIVLILLFESSSKLASAYGIAVTGTMLMTTLLFYVVARHRWLWPMWKILPLVLFFGFVDCAFLGSNLLKFMDGGWLPLLMGALVFTIMTTWYEGMLVLRRRISHLKRDIPQYLETVIPTVLRVPGTGIYLVAPGEGIPGALRKNVKHNKSLHETVIFLTLMVTHHPREKPLQRFHVQDLGAGCFHVTADYGFMEVPDVNVMIKRWKRHNLVPFDDEDITYFVSRFRPIATERPGLAIWRENLFIVVLRNAALVADFLSIPPDDVVEMHTQIDI